VVTEVDNEENNKVVTEDNEENNKVDNEDNEDNNKVDNEDNKIDNEENEEVTQNNSEVNEDNEENIEVTEVDIEEIIEENIEEIIEGGNEEEFNDGYEFEPEFIEYENYDEKSDKDSDSDEKSDSDSFKILWTNESISSLKNIMTVINKHKLMKPIGYLVKYYINIHQPIDIEYKIVTVDGTNSNISRDVMILACICEIRLRKKYKKTKIISGDLAYRSFGRVIYDVVDNLYRYHEWELGFGEVYIINDILSGLYVKTEDSRHIISVSYYITKQIMDLEQRGKIIQFMDTLVIRCEDMDLTFMTNKQIQDIMAVLKTKRKLYVKIWLVITEYLLRKKMPICQNFVYNITTIRHSQDFNDFMYDPIVDVLITVSASMILINPAHSGII